MTKCAIAKIGNRTRINVFRNEPSLFVWEVRTAVGDTTKELAPGVSFCLIIIVAAQLKIVDVVAHNVGQLVLQRHQL